MPVSREATAWAMQLLLDQQPDETLVDLHSNGYNSLEELRTTFLQTDEAKKLFQTANGAQWGDGRIQKGDGYTIPPFLLRRPAHENVPWQFAEPSIENPVTQLCTSEQMQTQHYKDICTRLELDPAVVHRKIWEFVYIVSALEARGMLAPGRRGLGFGTGQEPLPSVFAQAGVQVTATDAPADLDFSAAWEKSAQWSNGLDSLWRPAIVDREVFFDRVQFRPADMNNIPTDLKDFDFCWSACCFEHLGSIRMGLDFLHNSLATLKPGGVSVQTTEFNLGSDTDTLDVPGLAVFLKRDIEQVMHELIEEGHSVEPLNTWPGALPVDEHIDLPPYSEPHLKLLLAGQLTTSIGLIITKKM
ncbi:class I SAM-dependent methyltransferase [Sphingobium sp.]|uniref:class I SAM-dependent methyltransferase n=1 Tax=Sphingobium sp. TaxID=1912891 RepID=UPI002C6268AB|nr:class I SAM-dependent methyltransferase [Sphingobium sp.]HUD94640.1 class I SAM-dependent methyltransferase [Sphingobium sp.]